MSPPLKVKATHVSKNRRPPTHPQVDLPPDVVEALKRFESAIRSGKFKLPGPLPKDHPFRQYADAWQRRRERELEHEAAAAAAKRHRRKAVGGAPGRLTPAQVEAARDELRRQITEGEYRKLSDLKAWAVKRGFTVSDTTWRRHVIWPVLGKSAR
jgi:Mg-chelatase subunit ChlI